MESAKILGDWHPFFSPHWKTAGCREERGIKLRNFAWKLLPLSTPSLSPPRTLSCSFFLGFTHGIRSIYSIHRIVDRHWAALSIYPPSLLFLFPRVRYSSFCFSRDSVFLVSRTFAKHHSPQVIHLSFLLRTSNQWLAPHPPIKGAYRGIFRAVFLSLYPFIFRCTTHYFPFVNRRSSEINDWPQEFPAMVSLISRSPSKIKAAIFIRYADVLLTATHILYKIDRNHMCNIIQ